ncbi:MAG: DUF4231 domain-containing protein [Gammaproteobacteria bacterium]|nr:DUF4231 domain-containing protein [Gammaproteobacteria bacterium]
MNDAKFEGYVANRYEDQIKWYGEKSRSNKNIYQWFQWGAIVLSSTIPVLVVTLEGGYKWITAGLSVILAIATAGLKTFKFQENWINYRTIAETLKKEKHYFDADLNEYATAENKQQLFVERVETLISRENTLWVSAHTKKDEETGERGLTKPSSGRAKDARR